MSRRRFADYVKTSPKSMLHVRHDYFSSFNQSNHCFLSLSLPLQFFRRLIRLHWSRGGNTALWVATTTFSCLMFSSLMFLRKQFWKRLYFSVLAIVLAKVPPLGLTSPCNCSLFCFHVKCIWLGDLFFNSLSSDGNDHFISSVLSLNIVGFIRSCHWTQINPFLFWSFV